MQPRTAILIDAENMPARYWPMIREKVEASGTVVTCRIFGDFSSGRCGKWLKIAHAEALQTVMQLSAPNACDIAITVAAMDLLATGRIDAVCLVSSDRDFTPLVHRLRSGGVKVHGYGEAKTGPLLRKACTTFTELPPKTIAVARAA